MRTARLAIVALLASCATAAAAERTPPDPAPNEGRYAEIERRLRAAVAEAEAAKPDTPR